MADQTLSPWRRTVRSRVVIAAVLLAGWGVVIEGQLVRLQVVQHEQWQARGEGQRRDMVDVPATRGAITDRHGKVLAYSVDGDAVAAVPTAVKDVPRTVRALCDALGDCTEQDRAQMTERLSRQKPFAYVRHAVRVRAEAAQRIKDLDLPGIFFMKEPLRFYPNKELAGHVIGYVGAENKGLSGVELNYDRTLRGRDGSMLLEMDGSRQRRPFASVTVSPTPGPTLQLTIDYYLQFIAEQELKAAVDFNNAQGGSVVIMDPFTGDILALANAPSIDPKKFGTADQDDKRNRAIQDMYEPGSTFKIVTASAAIEEGVMRPDDMVDVSAGSIRIGSRKPIFDTHRYGVLSFTDVLVKSSNVGAIKIGQKVGAERLGRYARGYGFGTRLGRDFKGVENAGRLEDPSTWSESTLASVSMGYQVGVTALQMATTASTVANGGELRQPRIVRAQVNADGSVTEVPPRVVRRVIQRKTAEQLTAIMEQVVERGTATAAKIPGYTIAGKTGTSAKLENGHYSKSDYNASFVGFIPSRNPALAIIVVIDSPHGHGYYGGVVSAPVFKRIGEKAMQYLGIPPNLEPSRVLLAARHEPAEPARPAPMRAVMSVPPSPSAARPDNNLVPDVIGLGAREAIRVLARVGMKPARVSGDGVVVQQEPRAGGPLERGMTCTLALGRPAVSVPVVSDQRQ